MEGHCRKRIKLCDYSNRDFMQGIETIATQFRRRSCQINCADKAMNNFLADENASLVFLNAGKWLVPAALASP